MSVNKKVVAVEAAQYLASKVQTKIKISAAANDVTAPVCVGVN